MKNKKITILIIIIAIAPILILLSIFNGSLSGETRNAMGTIGFGIYILAMLYSLWLIKLKKDKDNK